MRTIKTLVADDEFLGRSRVLNLLKEREGIAVLAEAKNGMEAINAIESYQPDLVFLDIEMPGLNGIQVVNKLPEATRPFIIFVTAHDRFALKAFDLQAVDFLHKPYDDERFFKALDQAIEQIELRDKSSLNDQILRVMDNFRAKTQHAPNLIMIKDRGREFSVNLYDVRYIEADGNYLKLQLDKERHLIRNTMQSMVDQLDSSCFLRVHRSLIINTNFLKNKSYKGNNEYAFRLKNGEEFISGRSYKENIDEFFLHHS